MLQIHKAQLHRLISKELAPIIRIITIRLVVEENTELSVVGAILGADLKILAQSSRKQVKLLDKAELHTDKDNTDSNFSIKFRRRIRLKWCTANMQH